ncbi:hypothetical protein IAR55_004136 [Kwoniella newhampshirensis]|uniref:Uncharacterized protein n=1 Tax=Kwoniella newhampshirensis TaxID=1651941 RepID=A0AAW0YY97_9TREE
MTFSSLADELANASVESTSVDGSGVSRNLAEEFGLEFIGPGGMDRTTIGDVADRSLGDHALSLLHDGPPWETTHSKRGGRRPARSSTTFLDDSDGDFAHQDDELDVAIGNGHSFTSDEHSPADDVEVDLHDEARQLELDTDHLIDPEYETTISPSKRTPKSSTRACHPYEPTPSPPRGYRGDQDPLITLAETLATISRFLTSLRRINHHPKGFTASPIPNIGNEKKLEMKLQMHLEKVVDSARVRGEQIGDLGVIRRELETADWGEADNDEVLQTVEEEEEKEEDQTGDSREIGWTGELTAVQSDHGDEDRAETGSVETDHIDAEDGEKADGLLEQAISHSSSDDGHLLSPPKSTPGTQVPLLPRQTSLLITDTTTLIALLQSLSETLHTSTSLSTSLQRQVRGIRAGVVAWRERENQEMEARRAIEGWEGRKVREGLRGSGGTKEVLKRECKEFEGKLEAWGTRMAKIRRGVTAVS